MNSNFNQSENQIQRGKNYKIPLIVIGLLIIVLIGVFIFFNIKKHDTANIYYTVIDNMSEFLTTALEENNLVNPIGYEGTIKTNININDSDNTEFYKILNNSTLSFDLERDINKKVVNIRDLIISKYHNNFGDISHTHQIFTSGRAGTKSSRGALRAVRRIIDKKPGSVVV